ncbi:MAG: DUF3108 domain-containing protein [Deltaproteobacteria bacterium]
MLTLALLAGLAAPPVAAPATRLHPAFGPGEELVYDLTFLGGRAGMAQIDVGAETEVDGKAVWPLVIRSQSTGPVNLVYSVRDRFVAFWDFGTGLSVEARLDALEKGSPRRVAMRFARGVKRPDGSFGTLAQVQIDDSHGRESFTRSVEPAAEDLASAVFWLRTKPLKVGDRVDIPIFTGKKEWSLGATVVDRQPIETRAGKFSTVHVRLQTSFSGKLGSRRDLDGYFTDDPRHVPVRLDADLLIGQLEADLVSLEPGRLESRTP